MPFCRRKVNRRFSFARLLNRRFKTATVLYGGLYPDSSGLSQTCIITENRRNWFRDQFAWFFKKVCGMVGAPEGNRMRFEFRQRYKTTQKSSKLVYRPIIMVFQENSWTAVEANRMRCEFRQMCKITKNYPNWFYKPISMGFQESLGASAEANRKRCDFRQTCKITKVHVNWFY
eukprot:6210023-Pleurochrysis_carterae.AAC.2